MLAARIAAVLRLGGRFTVATNTDSPNIINISSGTITVTQNGVHSVTGLDPAMIVGRPGVAAGNVAVPINQSMTAVQVRDAIRTALAATFNSPTPAANLTNTAVWKAYNNTIKLFGYNITNRGVLGARTALAGDQFGSRDGSAGDGSLAKRNEHNAITSKESILMTSSSGWPNAASKY